MVSDAGRLIDAGPRLADPALVGLKFARQAELSCAGFPVPVFACLPAPVFDVFVTPLVAGGEDTAHSGPIASAATSASVAHICARADELARRVRAAAVPPTLLAELDRRFDEIAGPSGFVAVRACTVAAPGSEGLAEDGAADPFAGMSTSYLYVRREELAERIAGCWASAFNAQAAVYRARRGLDPFGARVAVGVQRMVMGTRSFVAFSRDPRDGASRVVVAAAHGIGEGVVQEKADIDHYFVDRASRRVESAISVKRTGLGLDPARPQDGPVAFDVHEGLAEKPVLAEDELSSVVGLALRAERHFGAAQDIEGTITLDGLIHLVQSRPIALEAAQQPGPEHGERPDGQPDAAWALWDNSNVTESFPHVSSALTYSVARGLYEIGFTDLYRRMGVPARTLRRNGPLLRRMIGHLDGRIYYRIDSWYRLHAQMRCFRPLWPTWEQSLGLAPAATGKPPRGGRRLLRALVFGFCYAEILARTARHPRRVRAFLTWWDGYHPQLADASTLGPDQAVDAYVALWDEVGRRWGVTLTNGVFLFAATRAVTLLMERWLPGADRALLNGLLCGGPENRSAQALNSLIDLAASAGAVPALRAAVLADAEPQDLWHDLAGGAYGEQFAAQLAEHVRLYGDRALHDLKLESVTPRDQPWTVLPTLRAYVRQGTDVAANRTAATRARDAAERELRERCGRPLRRAIFRGLMRLMRYLARVREDTRFCRSQLIGDSRALLTRLGAALAEAGRLDEAADVFDLTVEEVTGALDGTLAGADLRALAAVRAAERQRWSAAEPLPRRIRTRLGMPLADALAQATAEARAEPAPQNADPAPDGVLTGLASSSGVVRGRAKVVLDPSTSAEECEDRILIARETDPGWLFLMMSAKALVVERGTLLSHTAITGRLLGVPTVVAVRDAATLIPDGGLVEVDGSAGTVRILEAAP